MTVETVNGSEHEGEVMGSLVEKRERDGTGNSNVRGF
jgi:hypothetical protein